MFKVGGGVKFVKIDFTTNNCGAYYSDGRIQASVSRFKTEPTGELDYGCQFHDLGFSLSTDEVDRRIADIFFLKSVKKLGLRGLAYGVAVRVGNNINRRFSTGHNLRGSEWYTNLKPSFYPLDTISKRKRMSELIVPTPGQGGKHVPAGKILQQNRSNPYERVITKDLEKSENSQTMYDPYQSVTVNPFRRRRKRKRRWLA